ncbi:MULTISPECIES: MFS transporter [unclassified Nocardioides]|uniref:MFS transporter n=1 Tax=unclassified Nocardioides TaxID=2615069 RepID=UPI0009EFDCCD|nr:MULTISPECIES: MFS transporter [unclassified Nocardioides]GAW49871.1 multidrug resistance transporter, MFS superfamily protein [Nocardioides sp. PD653-B2]GAW54627.1 multidrug resistance transporter, MFS superfamily protein [Nocardioides sp. PD653]
MARTDRRTDYRVTFLVLCVGVSSFSLLQSMVNPVLPTIEAALDTDQATVTWVLTAYLLSASVFTPIIGRVGDKVGKERMLVFALAALAVGSLLAAVAPSIWVLVVARAIQGIGGGVLPLTFGIIRDEFPRDKVAGAVGTSAALLAVGGGVGLVIAGPVVDALSYHWLFWIPMVMTLIAAIAAAVFVPESPERTPGRINVGTAVLLSAWLVALLLAVSQGHSWGWSSGRVIGLFVAAAVLLPTWVIAESRSAMPLIDMKMMRIPTVWTVNLVALLFGMGMYSMFAFLPQFLQTPQLTGYGFGVSVTESGLLLLPQTAATFVAGVFSGRLAARYGSKAVLVVGATLTALGTLGLTLVHDQLWQIVVETTVLGLAFGLAFAAMSNLVVDAVPQTQTGVASGMNANIRTVGGALGGAVLASVVTAGARPDGFPVEAGYTHGFGVLVVTSALAALVAVFVPVVRAKTHVVPGPQAEAEAEAAAAAHAPLAADR